MTCPAWPLLRIRRVDATFNDRRISVRISSSEGKLLNCRGSFRYRATSRTVTEKAMLNVSIRSSRIGGTGTIIRPSTTSTATALRMLLLASTRSRSMT